MQKNIFEEIKRTNEYGSEYWLARELAKILEYKDFSNFENAMQKAKIACENSKQDIHTHFGNTTEMVKIGSGAERPFPSYALSRYACYLIIQNSDPSKEVVAMGQTYFAIQTRRQENTDILIEDNKRTVLRGEIRKHNTSLAEAADNAGVENYGKFQNYGYKGLYGGLDYSEIHKEKKLKKSQKILDHMGSEELAANLFRATQTDAKLRRENVQSEDFANLTHHQVGQKVRRTIEELGGTMPEKLPVADSVEKAKTRLKKDRKKLLKK